MIQGFDVLVLVKWDYMDPIDCRHVFALVTHLPHMLIVDLIRRGSSIAYQSANYITRSQVMLSHKKYP